jgi:23S rRNA (cytidine2498-2'-O)-methyltransferase
MNDVSPSAARFIFCVCQFGAENAAKREALTRYPDLALAFSRRGFVTFKVRSDQALPDSFELKTTLARTSGWSTGRVVRESATEIPEELFARIQASGATCVHVWERDRSVPGDRGFEPGTTPLAQAVADQIRARLSSGERKEALGGIRVNELARRGERVFDVALVEPDSWWVGWHIAWSPPRRWPGGVPPFDTSVPKVSRAYWKLAEALAWSRLPMEKGQTCVELGAAPGGACQLLLERGLRVLAVDPAELHESIRTHPHLVHLRCRSREVRRVKLKSARWLLADLNVAPKYTLDTVQDIVTHSKIRIRGMILTLKLMDAELPADLGTYLARIRSWGFATVRARQLALNRSEICVMASREKL